MAERIVFFGSPDFAVPSLEALIENGMEPVLVVTQPDRPTGRGREPTPTKVKSFALEKGLEVECIGGFRKSGIIDRLKELRPDYLVVVAFGLFLPDEVLGIAKANINLHASLLPAYRGASPINHAILNGDCFTGVTTIEMAKEMDSGPIYLQRIVPIDPFESAGELSDRLALVGAGLLVETIKRIDECSLKPVPQGEDGVSFARKLAKKDGAIPWETDAISVHNHIRGMHPWPGSFFYHDGNYIKVLKAEPVDVVKRSEPAGTVIHTGNEGIEVACGLGVVRLKVLQAEGRKALEASTFLRGYRMNAGDILRSDREIQEEK